ncbi:MAG TPA: hypothetical protein VG961_06680, partial [Ignavibacteria bacterium]|nr:hypothetical protein [Ignavibacteria bacterium]
LFLLTDSLLSADPDKYKYSVKLYDVKSFSIRNGYSTFGGAKYGGFIGGSLGLIFGIMNAVIFRPNFAEIALSIPGLGAIGFVGGAFIGGILGSAISYFEEYSKFSDDTHAKREILKRIFKKHNLR